MVPREATEESPLAGESLAAGGKEQAACRGRVSMTALGLTPGVLEVGEKWTMDAAGQPAGVLTWEVNVVVFISPQTKVQRGL